MAPDQSCASRAEQPFVAASNEEVAAQVLHADIIDPEPVDAIDAEQRPVRLGPVGVHLG